MTTQEIEQLKQELTEKKKEIKTIYDKLAAAGVLPLDDDDLDEVAGGIYYRPGVVESPTLVP